MQITSGRMWMLISKSKWLEACLCISRLIHQWYNTLPGLWYFSLVICQALPQQTCDLNTKASMTAYLWMQTRFQPRPEGMRQTSFSTTDNSVLASYCIQTMTVIIGPRPWYLPMGLNSIFFSLVDHRLGFAPFLCFKLQTEDVKRINNQSIKPPIKCLMFVKTQTMDVVLKIKSA